jgi:uridine phosphorylase
MQTRSQEKQHHIHLFPGDSGDIVFMPGDVNRAKIIADHFDQAELVAKNRQYITYRGTYRGVSVSTTSTGIGGPALAIAVEELMRVGAKTFIRIGTGGGLQKWLPIPAIIIGTAAIRGDGTSREYFPLEYPAIADFHVVEALLAAAADHQVEVFPGIIRGHDAFYAESIFASGNYLERSQTWIDAKALITSNESSTLFPLAMANGCRAGTILTAVDCHQRPELEVSSTAVSQTISKTIEIALDAALKLHQLDQNHHEANA